MQGFGPKPSQKAQISERRRRLPIHSPVDAARTGGSLAAPTLLPTTFEEILCRRPRRPFDNKPTCGGPRSPGPDPCVQLAGQNGISSLLAGADACAQQDNADAMIDFSKKPGIKNQQALIANAIAYRKHPRNALNINPGASPNGRYS
ncbi:hypothetical protein BGW80DRAFT_1254750 [Lactifluus volemus]|nr:hypothetical protein BGW80DRAFT_1254750 [Lactifluus volemus]